MSKIKDRLVYGAMMIGGEWNDQPPNQEEMKKGIKTLEAAYELGFRQYDHADIYTFGKSEIVFSEFMKQFGIKRDDVHIQTKVGIVITDEGNYYNFSKEHILNETKKCLERLNVDYVDRLLLHRPDILFDPVELKEAIDQLFKEKLIKDFGVSNMSKDQIMLFEKISGRKVTANQLELSLKHNNFVGQWVDFNTSNFKDDVLNGTIEHCMMNDITIQAWGSMAQGIYSGRSLDVETSDTVRQTANLVERLANEKVTSRENIVLEWLMMHPANIQPIVGTTNPNRIQKLEGLNQVSLTRQEWYKLYQTSRGHNLP